MKPNRLPIGLNDRDGTPIHIGDKVRFYFSEEEGPSHEKGEDRTEMIDTVELVDGAPYFICPDTGGGAHAWRYNKHCVVLKDGQ